MAIEVMLMADVETLGALGAVVRVSDGYARNYLFPRKLAAPVTAAAKARLAKLQREADAARAAAKQGAAELCNRLAGVSVLIPARVSESDNLYGSVGAGEIVAALKAQGFELDRHAIALDEPFKTVGSFVVTVKLHPEIETTIGVRIVGE